MHHGPVASEEWRKVSTAGWEVNGGRVSRRSNSSPGFTQDENRLSGSRSVRVALNAVFVHILIEIGMSRRYE